MGVSIEGLDELQEELEALAEDALGLSGTNEVPMEDLLTDSFMRKNTDFGSFEAFIEASPWTVENQADFEAIPESEFDDYVDEQTVFNSWEAMLSRGGEEWAARQLR